MAVGRLEHVLRSGIAIMMLPLCVAVTLATRDLLIRAAASTEHFTAAVFAVVGGGVIWTLIYIFLPNPMRAYILGHELAHAIWGIVFGAKVSKLKVKANGGSVRLTKTNTLITLAPYFFPFYTMLLAVIWLIFRWFFDPVPFPLLWLFLTGLSWSFHVTFTCNSLLIHQPDIVACGRFFSYVLIYLLNMLGIGLWLVCTTPAAATDYAADLVTHTRTVSGGLIDLARQAVRGVTVLPIVPCER